MQINDWNGHMIFSVKTEQISILFYNYVVIDTHECDRS